MRGLGAVTNRRAQGALRIGALMAFRLEGSENWCVGIVRRLQSDAQKTSQVGAEIFSKDPHLLWMKKLGFKQDEAWNWEMRDQKSMQHFTEAVLLAPDPGSGRESSLLLAPQSYFPEETFGVMVDNKLRKLQIGAVVEKNDGFDRVAFKWLAVDAALQARVASASARPPSTQAPSAQPDAQPPKKSGFMDDAI
jgi:hypothetical protein